MRVVDRACTFKIAKTAWPFFRPTLKGEQPHHSYRNLLQFGSKALYLFFFLRDSLLLSLERNEREKTVMRANVRQE